MAIAVPADRDNDQQNGNSEGDVKMTANDQNSNDGERLGSGESSCAS